MNSTQETLVKQINELYINVVGPIGYLLIDDAQNIWRKNQWQDSIAIRKYIGFLAENITHLEDRKTFVKAALLTTLAFTDNTQINTQAG